MAPQVVLMTGSSSGIGLAVATRLARDPEKRFLVIATVISMSEKDDLVAALGDALDSTAFIEQMDITKDDSISTVVEGVIAKRGRIDILLNIAGIQLFGVVENIPREKLDMVFNINTIGTIRLTQAVIPQMKQQMAGKIITITSYCGVNGSIHGELYCASKFAVEGFFEAFALNARAFNIWPSVIEPGPVPTQLLRGIVDSHEAVLADVNAHEIDKANLRKSRKTLGAKDSIVPVDDVVETFMRIIDDPEPKLRHPVYRGKWLEMGAIFDDPTGEALLALMK